MVLTFIKLLRNFQFENLLQPRGSLGSNTDDSCWKCFFCQSLYPFCAKAAMTIIHGLQAHNTNDLLEPQGLSATIQIQVDSEDKQIKQNAMQIYIDMPNTANVQLNITEVESF